MIIGRGWHIGDPAGCVDDRQGIAASDQHTGIGCDSVAAGAEVELVGYLVVVGIPGNDVACNIPGFSLTEIAAMLVTSGALDGVEGLRVAGQDRLVVFVVEDGGIAGESLFAVKDRPLVGVAAGALGLVGFFFAKRVGMVAVLEVGGTAQWCVGGAVVAHGATFSLLGVAHFAVQRIREGTDAVVLSATAMTAFAAKFGMQRPLILGNEGFAGQRIGCGSMALETSCVTN